MAEWGRKEYSKPWPSRMPVWTVTAILLSLLFFAGMLTWEYEGSWTAAERLYLSDYLKSGARGKASATASSRYTLLEAVVGKNQRLVLGDEIERVPEVDGRPGYQLTEAGVADGISRLEWVTGVFNDRGLHRVMSEAVYANHESWEFYARAVYVSLAFLVLALFVAIPKDRKRRMIWKHGRRLRGPGNAGGQTERFLVPFEAWHAWLASLPLIYRIMSRNVGMRGDLCWTPRLIAWSIWDCCDGILNSTVCR